LIKFRHALLQSRNARLEFGLVDQAFGVTVDEPIDTTPQCCHLTIETHDLLRRCRTVLHLVDAPLVLVLYAVRIFQQGPHLVPHQLIERAAMHCRIAAFGCAVEPMCFSANATVVVARSF